MDKETMINIHYMAVAAELARLHDTNKHLITGAFWTRANLTTMHNMCTNIIHQINLGSISLSKVFTGDSAVMKLMTTLEEQSQIAKKADSYTHINYNRTRLDPFTYKVHDNGYLYYNLDERGMYYTLQRSQGPSAIGNKCLFYVGQHGEKDVINDAIKKYGVDIESDIK